MSKKLIIGLTGQRGSGKSTAAQYLKTRHQADIRKFSQPLSRILKTILGLPNTRENLQNLAIALRKCFGQGVLARPLKIFIKQSRARIVVIDGLRVWE